MATAPTPITPLGTPPSRSDPVNFPARADTFLGALPTFATETNAIAINAYNNAVEANTSAGIATDSATASAESAGVALAASNFKGMWSTLVGAINKPASVKHDGRFWLLLNNLANVAASEPGITADWTSLDAGDVTQTVNVSTTMTTNVKYVVNTAGITLTAPSGMIQGDKVIAVDVSGGGFLTDWNGNTVKNDTQTLTMSIPPYSGYSLTYTGSTLA